VADCNKIFRFDDVSEMFSSEHPASVDELDGRVLVSGAGLKQRLGVERAQPDDETVVGGQSIDQVLQTGEGKFRHFTQTGGAQQSSYHYVIIRLSFDHHHHHQILA